MQMNDSNEFQPNVCGCVDHLADVTSLFHRCHSLPLSLTGSHIIRVLQRQSSIQVESHTGASLVQKRLYVSRLK